MPNATPGLDTILCEAVEIADAADRAAYLDRACGPDTALRVRAEALVAAHFRAASRFLERPPAAPDSTTPYAPVADDSPAPAAGASIGPYKLRERIGEGGMGLVFVAAMIVLASLMVVYQTSNILHEYGPGQEVGAALGLFASIATMFFYVLQLFMSNRD